MENDEDQTNRIKVQLKRLEETFAHGMDNAIEFHADMRARINMISASQQRSLDTLKGMKK